MVQRIRLAQGLHLYKRPNSPCWWADIHVGGQHSRSSTGESDRKKASDVARQLAKRLGKQSGANYGYSLYHALADWLDTKPRGRTDISAVKRINELYANRPAELVDDASVRAAFAALTPENANRITTVMRAALNLAHANQRITQVPKLTKRTGEKTRTRWLRREEIEKLLDALPAHLKPAFEFALLTGLRRSNVLRLRWDQVIDAKVVIEADQMKADKAHAVELPPRALEILKAQPRVSGYVFTYRGKPITSPKTAWRTATQKAGVKNVRWHDLRHTWASYMAMSGASLLDLQNAGGWSSVEMVERYAHLAQPHIATAVERAAEAMFKEAKP